jgi:endonuclease IV
MLIGRIFPPLAGRSSISAGLDLNCTAFQIFTKSNRQWQAKPLDPAEVERITGSSRLPALPRWCVTPATCSI